MGGSGWDIPLAMLTLGAYNPAEDRERKEAEKKQKETQAAVEGEIKKQKAQEEADAATLATKNASRRARSSAAPGGRSDVFTSPLGLTGGVNTAQKTLLGY